MGKVIFVTGGARSGKSKFALTLAKKEKKRVAFIATCQAQDEEMSVRILSHRKARPKNWQTFEESYAVAALFGKIKDKYEVVLIDCLTLLVSNLMHKGLKENAIIKEFNKILGALKESKTEAIIVSNEVGMGIVPENKLARDFRDIAGKTNQAAAKGSDEVYFMVSGIPWRIK